MTLQAATLELREYTVTGDSPMMGSPTKELDAHIDKGLIALNASLSLPIPPSGKISYDSTKKFKYGDGFGKNGLPTKTTTRDVGVTVRGNV